MLVGVMNLLYFSGTYLEFAARAAGCRSCFWIAFKPTDANSCTLQSSCDAVDMCGDRVDCLPKRWPRKVAKVNVGSRRPAPLARKLGNQRIDVMGVLGEGALAVVFSCMFSEDQRDVAVKVERQVRTSSVEFGQCTDL